MVAMQTPPHQAAYLSHRLHTITTTTTTSSLWANKRTIKVGGGARQQHRQTWRAPAMLGPWPASMWRVQGLTLAGLPAATRVPQHQPPSSRAPHHVSTSTMSQHISGSTTATCSTTTCWRCCCQRCFLAASTSLRILSKLTTSTCGHGCTTASMPLRYTSGGKTLLLPPLHLALLPLTPLSQSLVSWWTSCVQWGLIGTASQVPTTSSCSLLTWGPATCSPWASAPSWSCSRPCACSTGAGPWASSWGWTAPCCTSGPSTVTRASR
mmetsp:Transcript_5114/g.11127  ORF Transcript_5114/g.11127 Transcript_5114/m.11127 type:complete len:266 (+) Transcript_5114:387-1184(+)